MGLFKKLFSLFSTTKNSGSGNFYPISVKCNRCGEIIEGRINLANDLSIEYEEGNSFHYICRKVFVGTKQCFQRVDVHLTFDAQRSLIEHHIVGGTLIHET
jgi:hypothetical protein